MSRLPISTNRLAAALSLGSLLLAGACSPLRKVQRRDPLSHIVIGGNYGSESEADGTNSSGSLGKLAYVPGASKASGDDSWTWRVGLSAQQWQIEESDGSPEVLFRDIELFVRQPDLLCTNPAEAQCFRLAGQFGTFWADYKFDSLQQSGSSRWRSIPLLAYRATIEPDVLLLFGEQWEVTAFANVHGAVGAAFPSSGGGNTDDAMYDLTSFLDYGYEAGFRAVFGPVFGQVSFQTRYLKGGSSSADPDGPTGPTYPRIEAESSTIEGVWLLMGVAF